MKVVSRVDFGGVLLPKLVLGCDPFQIFSCFYPNPEEKLSFYREHFSQPDNIIKIVKAAAGNSINALNFCLVDAFLEAVVKMREDGLKIDLIPLFYQFPLKIGGNHVPGARTEATVTAHRMYIRDDPFYKDYVRASEFKRIESAKPLSEGEIEGLELDRDGMELCLTKFSEMESTKLLMTCIELYAFTGRFDLLKEARDFCESLGFSICAGSHMAEPFEILDDANLRFTSYYATLNKIGFFMLPNQSRMLRWILKGKEPLIAIKPLAGGRIPPKEAFDYIFGLRKNVVCMFGASSVEEVNENAQYMREMEASK